MFCVFVGFCWLVKPRFLSCHPENGKRALGSRKMKRILWLYFWPEALLPCVDARLLLSLPVPLLGVVLRFFFKFDASSILVFLLGSEKKKKKVYNCYARYAWELFCAPLPTTAQEEYDYSCLLSSVLLDGQSIPRWPCRWGPGFVVADAADSPVDSPDVVVCRCCC